MTVADLAPSIEYLEDGVTLSFAAPFRYLAAGLAVTRILANGDAVSLPYGTAWSATDAPTDAGGTLTLTATIAGSRLRIRRATARRQSADYTTGDRFPAETHEMALDRAMLIDQEQDVEIDDIRSRALLWPDGETASVLPAKATFAGKFFAGDVGGNPVPSFGTGADLGLRSDLAADGGSGLMAFSQAQAYAAGSVGARLKMVVSVKDRPYSAASTGLIDVTAAFQAAHDAMTAGGLLIVPPGSYLLQKINVTNRNITVWLMPGATLIRSAAVTPVAGTRGMFMVLNMVDANFRLEGSGTIDLNGEGPEGIGIAGRIANTYATQTVAGVKAMSGPPNSAIYALRASGIYVGPGIKVKNTGESAFLFRNCGGVECYASTENVGNYGAEFNFPLLANDGGTGPVPELRRYRFGGSHTDIEDFGLGTGNGGAALFGGGLASQVITDVKVDIATNRCLRDVQVEFSAGSYIDGCEFKINSLSARLGSVALIGARAGTVDLIARNPGAAPAGSTLLPTLPSSSYADPYGLVLSSDVARIDAKVNITDSRNTKMKIVTDGVTTAGSDVVTSASAGFRAADLGHWLGVANGVQSQVAFTSRIIEFISATQVRLARPVPAGLAGATVSFRGAIRFGVVIRAAVSAQVRGRVEAGTNSGLASEPVAAAVLVEFGTGDIRLDVQAISPMLGVVPDAYTGTTPVGLKVNGPLTGTLDFRGSNFIGFDAAEVGTYTNSGQMRTAVAVRKNLTATPAVSNAYGTEVFATPRMTAFDGLAWAFLDFAGINTGGGESIGVRITTYNFDGVASQILDVNSTTNTTVNLTAAQLALLLNDNVHILKFGVKAKSSLGATAATAKFNFHGSER